MMDKKSFKAMKSSLEKYDAAREKVIRASRDVLKNSKLVIYAIQRDNLTQADSMMKSLEMSYSKIIKLGKGLEKEGSFRIAMQEYVEAACFHSFVRKKRIPTYKALRSNAENYLAGLCDLTGELGRKAVLLATKQDFQEVEKIKDLVEEIHGEILKLNLRNGELRKKSDAVKWNLKKIEELMYDAAKNG